MLLADAGQRELRNLDRSFFFLVGNEAQGENSLQKIGAALNRAATNHIMGIKP